MHPKGQGMKSEKEQSNLLLQKILKVVGIVIGALIIGAAVFFVFKLRSDAKDVLREAKNTRMALQSADIEMYAQHKTVFNPANPNGLEEDVPRLVEQIYKPQGIYKITSYNVKNHEVTGMTYENGHFFVVFEKKAGAEYWDVDYHMNVYHFDDAVKD